MRNVRISGLVLLLIVLTLLPFPTQAQEQDLRQESRLHLAGPEDTPLGNQARLIAHLEDDQGNPLAGTPIVFTSPASFAGTVAEVDIAEIHTDEEGLAILDYQLRVEGPNQFIGRFHGNDVYRPAEASAVVLATGSAQLAQPAASLSLPFLGSWLVLAVLLSVWFVYLVVMLLISQIPGTNEQHN